MEHQDTMDRPQMTSLLLFVAIGYITVDVCYFTACRLFSSVLLSTFDFSFFCISMLNDGATNRLSTCLSRDHVTPESIKASPLLKTAV